MTSGRNYSRRTTSRTPSPQYQRPPSREQRGRGTLGPRKTFRQKLVDAIFRIPPRMRLYIAIALLVVIIASLLTAVFSGGGEEDVAEPVATGKLCNY